MRPSAISIDRVQVQQVLTVLQDGLHHPVDELVERCPDLTQQQVSVVIDHLIKSGQICTAFDADGMYWVWV